MDSKHVPDQVRRLKTLAAASAVFQSSAKAQRVWSPYNDRIGPMPDTYVTAHDCMYTIKGLVIGGDWDAEHGWDFDGRFTVLADDGAILIVNGWMASEIEVL